MKNVIPSSIQEGDVFQFRDGERGWYVPWPDGIDARTMVFEMERPGAGNGGGINMARSVVNWRATYGNGKQDVTGARDHAWDIVAQIFKECPW